MSTFHLRGTIGFSGGVDSNPREENVAEGTAFGLLDGDISLEIGEEDSIQALGNVKGAIQDYENEAFEKEYNYSAKIELRGRPGDSVTTFIGAEQSKDTTDSPVTTTEEIWAGLDVDAPLATFTVRGTVDEYREEISEEEIVNDDLEDFDVRTYSAEVHAEIDTSWMLRPVFDARISAIDYLRRRPGKPERDATQYSVAAGMVVEAGDKLRGEIGLRVNERFFEEASVASVWNFGPNLEIGWEPNDRTSLQFRLYPSLEEPSYEDGLVRDTITAGFDWSYQATDRLRFKGSASIEEEREIGNDYRSTELEAYVETRFALRRELDVLLGGYIEHEIRYDDPDGGFTRAAFRAGLEASF